MRGWVPTGGNYNLRRRLASHRTGVCWFGCVSLHIRDPVSRVVAYVRVSVLLGLLLVEASGPTSHRSAWDDVAVTGGEEINFDFCCN